MSEKKALKRDVKAAWDRVKRLRAESAKRYAPADLDAAAEQLDRSAEQLRALAKQLSALNAMPPDAVSGAPAKKAKKKARAKKAAAKKRPASKD